MIRATSFSTRMPEYDVPIVDKAVDATWKRELPKKAPYPSTGLYLSVQLQDMKFVFCYCQNLIFADCYFQNLIFADICVCRLFYEKHH
jgi:hypothetical protein